MVVFLHLQITPYPVLRSAQIQVSGNFVRTLAGAAVGVWAATEPFFPFGAEGRRVREFRGLAGPAALSSAGGGGAPRRSFTAIRPPSTMNGCDSVLLVTENWADRLCP